MEPRHFLLYWRVETADGVLAAGGPLDHAASNQFDRVETGDTVWIVTVRSGRLFLIGRIRVDHRTNRAEAISRLGTDDVWDAEHHIFSDRPLPLCDNDVGHLAEALRFSSDGDERMTTSGGRVNAQQL